MIPGVNGGSQNLLKSPRSEGGELEFVSYTSSPLEKFFLEKLPEMNFPTEYVNGTDTNFWLPPTAYCEFVNSYEKQIMHWLRKVQVRAVPSHCLS